VFDTYTCFDTCMVELLGPSSAVARPARYYRP